MPRLLHNAAALDRRNEESVICFCGKITGYFESAEEFVDGKSP